MASLLSKSLIDFTLGESVFFPEDVIAGTTITRTVVQQPQAVTSSAARIQSRTKTGVKTSTVTAQGEDAWQKDAWDAYNLVGELGFLTDTVSKRAQRAGFFVGELQNGHNQDPTPVEDPKLQEVLSSLGGPLWFSQMIGKAFINLTIPGEFFFVGVPDSAGDTVLTDIRWHALSKDEVKFDDITGTVTVETTEGKITGSQEDIITVRVWQPDPQYSRRARSLVKPALPILRELIELTKMVSAIIDSRLAGAGLLIIPSSVQEKLREQAQAGDMFDPDTGEPARRVDEDLFTDVLIDAMTEAIKDRSSAASVVPLVVTVPDELVDKIRHVSMAADLDKGAKTLRDESLQRLAHSLDAPPEVLFGMGSSTHWNSWLVKQDTIDSHIVPGLQLICDALTTEFLHPVMEMLGYPPEQIRRMVVWFDVSKLAEQVNTFKDALELFKVGAVSKETLRAAAGFDESDAPEEMDALDPKVQLVVDMVTRAPSLAVGGGMIDLYRQLEALIDGTPYEPPVKETVVEDVVEEEPVDEGSAGGGLPDTYDEPAPEEMEAP